jgi:hypothetical protein
MMMSICDQGKPDKTCRVVTSDATHVHCRIHRKRKSKCAEQRILVQTAFEKSFGLISHWCSCAAKGHARILLEAGFFLAKEKLDSLGSWHLGKGRWDLGLRLRLRSL